jgi:ADP-heptose:LPS heptosyltransferase
MGRRPLSAILVIKHGALGDFVQGFDALASLRASFPEAHICLLTSPPFTALAQKTGWFDEIVTDQRRGFWHLPSLWHIRRLFARGWDRVLDLQCSRRTAAYHRLFAQPFGLDWYGTARGCSHPLPDFSGINNAERLLITVERAGASRQSADLSFLADQTLSSQLASELPIRFSLLIAGCSLAKPEKRWPADRFAELARVQLAASVQPVLIGTSADSAALARIAAQVPQVLNWQSRTSLSDLLILSSQAEAIIGNDTGPTFLAARSGRPCLMVMGAATDPAMSAPLGAAAGWLKKDRIDTISVAEVLTELEHLSKKSR